MSDVLAYQIDHVDTLEESPPGGEVLPAYQPAMNLRRSLLAQDALALTAAWGLAVGITTALSWWSSSLYHNAAIIVAGVLIGIASLASQRLYLARTSAVRSLLIERIGRATVLSGAGVLLLGRLGFYDLPLRMVVVASLLAFSLLIMGRLAFESWLARQRGRGRYMRPVVLVGVNQEALSLAEILTDHPEFGLRIVAAVGDHGADVPPGIKVLGGYLDAVSVCRATGATGVLMIAGVIPPGLLNGITRELLDANVHVHFSSGLRGISAQRVRPLPLAYEPLLYIEKVALRRWQLLVKRGLDIVLAGLALAFVAPLLLTAALFVKLHDGGPVLFRQQRVGFQRELFTCFKLRTMVQDADRRLDLLQEDNQRDGPLFKLAADPRVTPIGRILRATSIDELPQLWNVLRGDMSLVGPRPALEQEMEQFDEQLRARCDVPPGITGLWQVEARDKPAFGPYRRLDLYYLENWSVMLDISILLSTVAVVLGRGASVIFQRVRPSWKGASTTLD